MGRGSSSGSITVNPDCRGAQANQPMRVIALLRDLPTSTASDTPDAASSGVPNREFVFRWEDIGKEQLTGTVVLHERCVFLYCKGPEERRVRPPPPPPCCRHQCPQAQPEEEKLCIGPLPADIWPQPAVSKTDGRLLYHVHKELVL
uniref:Uncharacterized protein n=1 Tax=Triticum urartu TaxID=4572 RepID=A0A8R7Q7H3_TRIUA